MQWFIIVLMATISPSMEGQPVYIFTKEFDTRQECMAELERNSDAYFGKAYHEFKIPPQLANCVDTNAINELKQIDTEKELQI